MAGEKDLSRLIAGMRPKLQDGVFVFTTLPPDAPPPAGIAPLMVFREAEGTTLILAEDQAQRAGVAATFRSRMITLEIHSSLEAVGFMAAIATRLAEAGMGVNPVTGDYSRGASGFLIENGAVSHAVTEITIAGNLKDMFAALVPANDLHFRYAINTPTLRIDGMTVAGG